jgi:hypothetical protein
MTVIAVTVISFTPVIINQRDKVYQLLVQGRWLSLDTPAPSTTKTGRHDIAAILLKVALNTKKSEICCVQQ